MKIKETIIVEGQYDKIKLNSILDADILVTDGFRIFKDSNMQKTIKEIAKKNGIIVFTDSDRAGFMIRNFIKSCIAKERVLHAFIPEIKGKEKRKKSPGKEGILGVEGIDKEIIYDAILKCGATIDDEKIIEKPKEKITKLDLYKAGLYGKSDSKQKRILFLKEHNLPGKISANMLVDILNILYQKNELF